MCLGTSWVGMRRTPSQMPLSHKAHVHTCTGPRGATHMAAMTSSANGGSSRRRHDGLPRCSLRRLAVAPCGSPRLSTSRTRKGVRDPSPPLVLPDQLGMSCCMMRVGSDTFQQKTGRVRGEGLRAEGAAQSTAPHPPHTSARVLVLLPVCTPGRRVTHSHRHGQGFPLRLHGRAGAAERRRRDGCGHRCASRTAAGGGGPLRRQLVHLLSMPGDGRQRSGGCCATHDTARTAVSLAPPPPGPRCLAARPGSARPRRWRRGTPPSRLSS